MAAIVISEKYLIDAINERLGAVYAEVTDLSGGCGQFFSSVIVASEFEGKNLLKRQRLVNTALKKEIAQLHAWSAKCRTPDEWERDKSVEATAGSGLEEAMPV